MANLTTTSDIKQAVLTHCGELTNGNSPYESRLIEYINRVYLELINGGGTFVPDLGEPWPWAKAQTPGVITFKAPYETGTVTLTQGLTAGTFSVAPVDSLVGQYLIIDSRPDVFRIATHVAAATAFTLDGPYVELGGVLNFKIHRLSYTLGGGGTKILRLIEPMRVYRTQSFDADGEGKIYGADPDRMLREWPLHRLIGGTPTHFAQSGEVDGVLAVRVNKSPHVDMRAEYEYVPIPAALTASPDTTPLVPREDRMVLVYGAAYWLMFDKEDSRVDHFFRATQSKIQAMILNRRREAANGSKNFGRLMPRTEQMRRVRELRSASGLEII